MQCSMDAFWNSPAISMMVRQVRNVCPLWTIKSRGQFRCAAAAGDCQFEFSRPATPVRCCRSLEPVYWVLPPPGAGAGAGAGVGAVGADVAGAGIAGAGVAGTGVVAVGPPGVERWRDACAALE